MTGEGPWREVEDCLEPEDEVVRGREDVDEGGERGCEVDIPAPAVGKCMVWYVLLVVILMMMGRAFPLLNLDHVFQFETKTFRHTTLFSHTERRI